MGLDALVKCRMRIIVGDTPTQNPLPQTLTFNLQKQDHAKIDSCTTPPDVTSGGALRATSTESEPGCRPQRSMLPNASGVTMGML